MRYSVVRKVKLNRPFARFFSCIPPISSVVHDPSTTLRAAVGLGAGAGALVAEGCSCSEADGSGGTEPSVRREDMDCSLPWPFSFEAAGFVGVWFGLVIGIADLAELRVARAD